MLIAAARDAVQSEEVHEDDILGWNQLIYFLEAVRDEPHKFRPTGKQAAGIRKVIARAKGTSQPQSRKNKRKARQERRMRTHKERRRFRKQIAESYNEARALQEQENAEMEAAFQELQERLEKQPKFRIMAADGSVLIAGVPLEMLQTEEGEPVTPEAFKPQLYVPGRDE
ncbi:MAG: DUF724 domain-containing protein [Dehalococcoidia bacterium]|nr:DUF724 domain-containing protein [Dehalococcoidia bacterium]